jgi:hypothetical protein
MTEAAVSTESLSEAEKNFQQSDDAQLYEWLSGLSGTNEIKASLERVKPEEVDGISTAGWVHTFNQPVTVEEIAKRHGGGTYRLKVQHRNKSGKWVYVRGGARTFMIDGDPKLKTSRKNGEAPSEMLNRTFDMQKEMLDDARERAERAESKGSGSLGAIAELITPLLQAQGDKEDRILELAKGQSDGDRGFKEVLDLLKADREGEGTRTSSMRAMYESEIRQLKQSQLDDIKRIEERHDRMIDNMERAHVRELATVQASTSSVSVAQQAGFDTKCMILEETAKRLERELSEKNAEIAELRARKEKTPLEAMQEVVAYRAAIEEISPSSVDDEGGSKLDKAIEIGGGLLERFLQPPAQAGAPQLAAAPDQGPMVQLPDGRVMPAGAVARLQAYEARRAQMAEQQGQPGPSLPDLDETSVKMAVTFMNSAFTGGKDPKVFATSAAGKVPESILSFIAEHGVDAFLKDVAKLDRNLPLSTHKGREWVRDVAKYLLAADAPPSEDS